MKGAINLEVEESIGKPSSPLLMLPNDPSLSEGNFRRIQRLVRQRSGISLGNNKNSLVVARLNSLLRQAKCENYDRYLDLVASDKSGERLSQMIDAMTTNHTAFYREPAHFEWLKKTVTAEFATRPRLDIWSAASSTGQEAFTIACAVVEALGPRISTSCSILASDISQTAIDKGGKAKFTEGQIKPVPDSARERFFRKSDDCYQVKPEISRMVEFRRHNLLDPPPARRRFSIIFLRNVLIYFDPPTQAKVVGNLIQAVDPGGYLVVGHSESLFSLDHQLETVAPSVYRIP